MITTLIGKTFLASFNEKYDKTYSAKDFFEQIYFELFFNHSKYMQWITNSPFVQMKKGQKANLLTSEERLEKLHALYDKAENEIADASFAIGYPAADSKEFASTSGMVSDIEIATEEDDIYYSWIGSGLGVGVAGGYNLLINDPEILMTIYDGWKYYRDYLNDPLLDKMRGNQINSWNGQWLTYRLGNNYMPDFKISDLEDEKVIKLTSNVIEINTVYWTNLFFSLSNLYPGKDLVTYVYSFGQTNKTIGFVPFYLKSGARLKDVWRQLYGDPERFNNREFQSLFGLHIKRACELGSVGLQALRPYKLKDHMKKSVGSLFKKESEYINYQTYKTWLVAMLSKNKQEITDYTKIIAELILRYRKGASGTERRNLINQRLFGEKSNKKIFLDALTEMVNDVDGEDLYSLRELKNEIHLMTNEEFGYFNTLLKFDYAFIEKTNN
ncbi:MAG: hypothetical protein PHV89_09655 [Fermentimonas sp.]|nr:hypothetical protein [Fermentimonas sp.]MDD3543534.1 hypothetical protein [Petrimonas sp.]MDD4285232.1 hypothetical protein [Fermentimonas sp.]MDD4725026.1 hypothetical protein [Fermentimonas sp.]